MDYESERSRKLGCWDCITACTPLIDSWSTNEKTVDVELGLEYCNFLCDTGFGQTCSSETRKFWAKTLRSNYQGDDGGRRMRMCLINLRERDGLHGRLFDVRCPVMWMHVSDSKGNYDGGLESLKIEFREPQTAFTALRMRRRRLRCL
jgi:hypothetical protein